MDRQLRGHAGRQGGHGLTPSATTEGRRGWSSGAALRWGFAVYRAHLGPLTLLSLLVLAVGLLVQLAGYPVRSSVTPPVDSSGRIEPGAFFGLSIAATMAVLALAVAAAAVVHAGLVRVALGLTRGERPDVGAAYRGLPAAAVTQTALVVGVVSFAGLMLCVVPALIGLWLTSYALFFVLDQGLPARDALRESFRLTTRNPGALGTLFLASVGLGAVGLCLCGVGLVVVVPVVTLAQAYTYKVFTGDPVPPPAP